MTPQARRAEIVDTDGVGEIIDRISPTICPTYSSSGVRTEEGRVLRADFEWLFSYIATLHAELSRLTAQVEGMSAALEPFANEAALTRETMQDARLLRHTTLWASKLTVGDLRRALAARPGVEKEETDENA